MNVSRALLTRVLLLWCLAATVLALGYKGWQGTPLGHPYVLALGLLLLAGVGAWWMLGRSLLGAVNVYGWAALIAAGMMVQFEATHHPEQGWSGMATVPLVGLGLVGYLTDDARSTWLYMAGALGTLVFAGVSFGDVGCAFVALFTLALLSMVQWARVGSEGELRRVVAALFGRLQSAENKIVYLKGQLARFGERMERLQYD